MVKPAQKYARDLSRRWRSERLIARAVNRAAKPAKTPPPGFPEEHTYTKLETDNSGARQVRYFSGGSAFPVEWR